MFRAIQGFIWVGSHSFEGGILVVGGVDTQSVGIDPDRRALGTHNVRGLTRGQLADSCLQLRHRIDSRPGTKESTSFAPTPDDLSSETFQIPGRSAVRPKEISKRTASQWNWVADKRASQIFGKIRAKSELMVFRIIEMNDR